MKYAVALLALTILFAIRIEAVPSNSPVQPIASTIVPNHGLGKLIEVRQSSPNNNNLVSVPKNQVWVVHSVIVNPNQSAYSWRAYKGDLGVAGTLRRNSSYQEEGSPVGLCIPSEFSFHCSGAGAVNFMVYSTDFVTGAKHREALSEVSNNKVAIEQLTQELGAANDELKSMVADKLTYDRIKDVVEREYGAALEVSEGRVRILEDQVNALKKQIGEFSKE